MKLLDLFCCAGGASMGYHRAGFDVVGVDVDRRPDYPFEFIQADALEVLADRAFMAQFDAVAASPPCQRYSTITGDGRDKWPDLIPPVQEALRANGAPYIIENVAGAARLLNAPVKLCGTAFDLGVWRHRFFESNIWLTGTECFHDRCPRPFGVYGREPRPVGEKHYRRPDGTLRGRKPISITHARLVLGIDWMTNYRDLAESIPPAFTEYLGLQLVDELRARAALSSSEAR